MPDGEQVPTEPADELGGGTTRVAARATRSAKSSLIRGPIDVVVEMGESRTPRPEPFAWNRYERVR